MFIMVVKSKVGFVAQESEMKNREYRQITKMMPHSKLREAYRIITEEDIRNYPEWLKSLMLD